MYNTTRYLGIYFIAYMKMTTPPSLLSVRINAFSPVAIHLLSQIILAMSLSAMLHGGFLFACECLLAFIYFTFHGTIIQSGSETGKEWAENDGKSFKLLKNNYLNVWIFQK